MVAMVMHRLRLGTRRSPLALAQSTLVKTALEAAHPGLRVELVPIVTEGDRQLGDLALLDDRVGGKSGKGLFTQELEEQLLTGELDLAVHSLKDLPIQLPPGLGIAAHPRRATAHDVLVCQVADSLEGLPDGAQVLTGSLRRKAQLLARRPDLEVQPVRGNVGTRVEKWKSGSAAAIILAAAGLERLGVSDLPAHRLAPSEFLPAPGQGILAIEVKRGTPAEELCRALDDPASSRAAQAERAVISAFGGDCTLPLGAWARPTETEGEIELSAFLAVPDGTLTARGSARGRQPQEVAKACVDRLRADDAESILAQLRV